MNRTITSNLSSTPVFVAMLLAAVSVVTMAMLVLPPKLTPYLVGGAILVGVVFVSIRYPLFLFYFIILSSATSGLRSFESVQLGGTNMTISGLRWMFVSGLALGMLFLIRIRMHKRLLPMVVFAVWVLVRWFIGPPDSFGTLLVPGAKDVLFYSTPALFGVFAYSLAHSGLGDEMLDKFEKAMLYGCFIPAVIYMITIPTGLVVMTPVGPMGDWIRPRAVSLFLQIVLALGLANWRYADTPRGRRLGMIVSLLSIGMIMFTLSRTATAVALLLLVMSRSNPKRKWTLIIMAVVGAMIAGYLFMKIPAFQERFFYREVDNIADAYQYLNTSGRSVMWSETYAKAIEAPLMGHGLAGSRLLLEIVINKEQPPHNEYLQVFHDMGFIGLFIHLLAWFTVLFDLWNRWAIAIKERDNGYARWCLAGFLGVLAIMLTATTDNTMHYAFVLAPAFTVVGLAYYYAGTRHKRRADKAPPPPAAPPPSPLSPYPSYGDGHGAV